jgi:hypothetical protein
MAQLFLLLALWVPSQEGPSISATLREAPDAGPGKAAGLLCEGTATLPDRSRIDAYLYFGDLKTGLEMSRDAAEVRDGRFSMEFRFYTPPRSLAGLHSVRLLFEPALQRQAVLARLGDAARQFHGEARLQIGSAADADRDLEKWRKALTSEIRAMGAIADEADVRYRKDRDARKWDPKEWERILREGEERSHDILYRVTRVPEYRALRLGPAADVGMDQLRNHVLHSLRSFIRALKFPDDPNVEGVLREARILRERSMQQITPVSMEADVPLLTRLGEEARKILKDALEGNADSRAVARSKFRETLITLDSRAPQTFHEAVIRLAGEVVPFFETLDSDPAKARELHAPLDRQLQDLLKDIEKLK